MLTSIRDLPLVILSSSKLLPKKTRKFVLFDAAARWHREALRRAIDAANVARREYKRATLRVSAALEARDAELHSLDPNYVVKAKSSVAALTELRNSSEN